MNKYPSEKNFIAALHASSDPMLLIRDGKFVECNEAATRILGYTRPQDVLRASFSKLSPSKQRDGQSSLGKLNDMLKAASEKGFHRFEWEHLRADGESLIIEVALTAFVFSGKSVFQCVWRDLTEYKRAELLIHENEHRFQQILDAIADMVLVKKAKSRIVWANKAFRDYYAMSNDQLKDIIDSPINEPDYTLQYIKDDLYVFETGKVLHIPEEPVTRHDGVVRPFETLKSPIRDSSGNVVMTVGVSRDILERKKVEDSLRKAYVELKNTKEQLLQSEKMATVGQLAAGVAHEINNPAGYVLCNLEVMLEHAETLKKRLDQVAGQSDQVFNKVLADLTEIIKESLDGITRIKRIVADLQSFSRMDEARLEAVDIHDVLQSSVNIAWSQIKYKAELVKEYSTLPLIHCYPQQLSQVFLNIIMNAAQAIAEKGKITLRTSVDGGMAMIEIIDTGCGMTEEIRRRVFDPFFTTKPVGEGTGLGLSLAFNIINKHNEELSVASIPGQGSAYTIRLPINVVG